TTVSSTDCAQSGGLSPRPPEAKAMLPRVYLLHGMKRSGNHAVINWLLPLLQCHVFNNVIPLGPLLRGAPMPSSRPFAAWWSEQESRSGASLSRALATLEDHDLQLAPFHEVDLPLQRILV